MGKESCQRVFLGVFCCRISGRLADCALHSTFSDLFNFGHVPVRENEEEVTDDL